MKNSAVDKEIAELNKTVQGLQQRSHEIFFELGKQYFGKHKDDPEPEFSQCVNDEKAVLEQIGKADTRIKFLHGIVVCTNCGMDNGVSSSFCQNCGTRLPHRLIQPQDGVKRCVKCGVVLNQGQRFCGACGTPVLQEAAADVCAPKEEESPAENEEQTKQQASVVTQETAAEQMQTAEAAATQESFAAKKICANCGAEIAETEALFCAECGAKI